MTTDNIVSFDDEPLILVDSSDAIVGYEEKLACHMGTGILHRAFSVFIFNDAGELLLQQRGTDKLLWPGYWANTCCSHPRRGETIEIAAHRRLAEELGMQAQLHPLFQFEYQANYRDIGSEYELCSVLVGRSNAQPAPNPTEIASIRYIGPEALDKELAQADNMLTPWLKIEWKRLRTEFWDNITSL